MSEPNPQLEYETPPAKSAEWGRQITKWTILMTFIVGAVGLFGGMVAGMILWPESNMAPTLGIFFTGPIGVVAGLISGLIIGIRKERRS
jgi:hypothetical protein